MMKIIPTTGINLAGLLDKIILTFYNNVHNTCEVPGTLRTHNIKDCIFVKKYKVRMKILTTREVQQWGRLNSLQMELVLRIDYTMVSNCLATCCSNGENMHQFGL